MNIPDKAYEAAYYATKDYVVRTGGITQDDSLAIADAVLASASKLIAAQALREHAAQLAHDAERSREDEHVGLFLASDKTWARADELDPQ